MTCMVILAVELSRPCGRAGCISVCFVSWSMYHLICWSCYADSSWYRELSPRSLAWYDQGSSANNLYADNHVENAPRNGNRGEVAYDTCAVEVSQGSIHHTWSSLKINVIIVRYVLNYYPRNYFHYRYQPICHASVLHDRRLPLLHVGKTEVVRLILIVIRKSNHIIHAIYKLEITKITFDISLIGSKP